MHSWLFFPGILMHCQAFRVKSIDITTVLDKSWDSDLKRMMHNHCSRPQVTQRWRYWTRFCEKPFWVAFNLAVDYSSKLIDFNGPFPNIKFRRPNTNKHAVSANIILHIKDGFSCYLYCKLCKTSKIHETSLSNELALLNHLAFSQLICRHLCKFIEASLKIGEKCRLTLCRLRFICE